VNIHGTGGKSQALLFQLDKRLPGSEPIVLVDPHGETLKKMLKTWWRQSRIRARGNTMSREAPMNKNNPNLEAPDLLPIDGKTHPDFLNVQDVARVLGVSVSTVYDLARQRKIRHRIVGAGRGRILFHERDVQEYLESCKVDAGAAGTPGPSHTEPAGASVAQQK